MSLQRKLNVKIFLMFIVAENTGSVNICQINGNPFLFRHQHYHYHHRRRLMTLLLKPCTVSLKYHRLWPNQTKKRGDSFIIFVAPERAGWLVCWLWFKRHIQRYFSYKVYCPVSKFRPGAVYPTPWAARDLQRAEPIPIRVPGPPKTPFVS